MLNADVGLAVPCLFGVGDVRTLSHAELREQRATLVDRGVVQERGFACKCYGTYGRGLQKLSQSTWAVELGPHSLVMA